LRDAREQLAAGIVLACPIPRRGMLPSMIRSHVWALVGMLALALPAKESKPTRSDPPCAIRTDLKGPCFDLRGRVSLSNGNPNVRIWRVGTGRILGIVGVACDEHPCGPSAMPDILWKQLEKEHDLYADLTVCPITKEREGWMQLVCIDSARNVANRPAHHP